MGHLEAILGHLGSFWGPIRPEKGTRGRPEAEQKGAGGPVLVPYGESQVKQVCSWGCPGRAGRTWGKTGAGPTAPVLVPAVGLLYLGQFTAILNQNVVMLGSFLGSFFGHFWSDGHFLVTFWSLFGSLLGAILGLMALV